MLIQSSVVACAEEDLSVLAREVIQLVWKIGGRATAAYVTDVFKGSQTAAIRRAGHDRLPGAGAGSKLACARLAMSS